MQIKKTIIISSKSFFTNQITFVLLLFVSFNLCLLFSTSENKFKNFLIPLFFKNSFPGKFSSSFSLCFAFPFKFIISSSLTLVFISIIFSFIILLFLESSLI